MNARDLGRLERLMDQELWALGADARAGLLPTLGLQRAARLSPDSSSTYLATRGGSVVALSSLGLWLADSGGAVRLDRRPHAVMVGPSFSPPGLPVPSAFRPVTPSDDVAALVATALDWVAAYEERVCAACGAHHRKETLALRQRAPGFDGAVVPMVARELAAAARSGARDHRLALAS